MSTATNLTTGDPRIRVLQNQSLKDQTHANQDLSTCRWLDSTIEALTLNGCLFSQGWASRCKFNRLNLDHTRAEHSYYADCDFQTIIAQTCFFTASHFANCTFDKTRSELSTFGLCCFDNTQWRQSKMSEVSFAGIVCRACEFRDEDYFFVRFPSALFVDTVFANCSLKKAIFRRATFIQCRFENCQLPDAVFHNADFIKTTFYQTDIRQAANIDGANGLDL